MHTLNKMVCKIRSVMKSQGLNWPVSVWIHHQRLRKTFSHPGNMIKEVAAILLTILIQGLWIIITIGPIQQNSSRAWRCSNSSPSSTMGLKTSRRRKEVRNHKHSLLEFQRLRIIGLEVQWLGLVTRQFNAWMVPLQQLWITQDVLRIPLLANYKRIGKVSAIRKYSNSNRTASSSNRTRATLSSMAGCKTEKSIQVKWAGEIAVDSRATPLIKSIHKVRWWIILMSSRRRPAVILTFTTSVSRSVTVPTL